MGVHVLIVRGLSLGPLSTGAAMSFAAYQGQAQELEALRAEHERERERL